ncbi:MAG: amino acid permease, partial [Candidatus Adiutrix sp.]|nr:amino acid permease [Candidatus Adiutrix sp.]
QGDLPEVFARENPTRGMPSGAPIMNGLVASAVVVIAPFISSRDIFWSFFALHVVTLLMSYIPLFPAFLKLRRSDPEAERPFMVSGGPVQLWLMVVFPVAFLIISIIFSCVPLSLDEEEIMGKAPSAAGVVITIVIGEILAARSAAKGAGPADN